MKHPLVATGTPGLMVLTALTALTTLTASAHAQTGGDTCALADPIAGLGLFVFDLTGALSNDTTSTCGVEQDVWLIWTAPSSGDFRFETCPTTQAIDTKLAVYPDAVCGSSSIACDDDTCQLRSTVELFGAVAGSDYHVQIGTFAAAGTTGAGLLRVIDLTPPAGSGGGDVCSLADAIAGEGDFGFDLTGAASNDTTSVGCGSGVHNDVWFAWTAPASGTFQFATCDTAVIDTKLAVYPDDVCGSLSVDCNDDACELLSVVTLPGVIAGNRYHVQIGTFDPAGAVGPGILTVTCIDPPPTPNGGESCVLATPIAGEGRFGYDLTGATSDNPMYATCDVWQDLWFLWTAPSNGDFVFATCDSAPEVDTKLALYRDHFCGQISIQCNDDSCGLRSEAPLLGAVSGVQYLVQVGTFAAGGLTGPGILEVRRIGNVGPIGTNYCGPALANSSGASGTISAEGVPVAGGNPLTLHAAGLPVSQFGFFLASQNAGFFSPPGSQGFICLAVPIYRFDMSSQIRNSGPNGEFELDVDTNDIPYNNTTLVLPGETWRFQAWFRDLNPGLTSNFTDGIEIFFQ